MYSVTEFLSMFEANFNQLRTFLIPIKEHINEIM